MAVAEFENVTISLGRGGRRLGVVRELNLAVAEGETLALVGESGCGKSTTALAAMGLLPDQFAVTGGDIRIGGDSILGLPERRLRRLRGARMSMIFQEPMTALNPLHPVGRQIAEAVRLHGGATRAGAMARALELLRAVEIPEPELRLRAYPHQLSGGMRQRVMIAMALAGQPKLLIADEPTTALDVTVQGQIFALLQRAQAETGMSILLITHDLDAVADVAHRVAIMYAGECVESGPIAQVLHQPRHRYTQALLACAPRLRLGAGAARPEALLPEIPGLVPPLGTEGPFCKFAPRCAHAGPDCRAARPPMVRDGARESACFHPAGAGA